MSSVTIDYDKLSTISRNANSAASRMNDYINDLTKKVTGKYGEIAGGSTSKTQNSEYYVNQKISQLRAKKDQYTSFATAVNSLSAKAQDIDKDVAKKIRASKDQFVDKHDYISTASKPLVALRSSASADRTQIYNSKAQKPRKISIFRGFLIPFSSDCF